MSGLDNLVDRAEPKNPKTLKTLLEKQIKFNDTLKPCALQGEQDWVTSRYAVPLIVRIYKNNPDLFAGVSSEKSELVCKSSHNIAELQGPVTESQINLAGMISEVLTHCVQSYYTGKMSFNRSRLIFDRLEFVANKDYNAYGEFMIYGHLEPFKFPLLDKAKPNEIFYWSKNVAPESGISVKSVPFSNITTLAQKELAPDFWRWLELSEIPITKDVEVAAIEQYIKEHS